MRWSELSSDGATWLIPGSRMKNGKPHDVHLSTTARNILRQLPRQRGQDLVFSTTGNTPISGFSRAKKALDASIVTMRAAKGVPGAPSSTTVPWRLHDVRRTGVSTLARLGVDSIVADKLLGHQAAKLRGVAAVYQRHDFANERARALATWAEYVIDIASDTAAKPVAS